MREKVLGEVSKQRSEQLERGRCRSSHPKGVGGIQSSQKVVEEVEEPKMMHREKRKSSRNPGSPA